VLEFSILGECLGSSCTIREYLFENEYRNAKSEHGFIVFLGTGTPNKGQDLATFGKQLCVENKTMGRDAETRSRKKLRPRRQSWVTETREYHTSV